MDTDSESDSAFEDADLAPAARAGAPKAAAGLPPAAPLPPPPELDSGVLRDAARLGLEPTLRNLAGRPEVASSGKSAREMLKALQASCGLVNIAKRALLAS